MRRYLGAFLCTLVAVLGVQVTALAERIQIEHSISQAHGQAVFDATKRLADLFNSLQDKITVNVTINPSGNYEQVVLTRLAGGAPPDVITSNRYSDLAPKGVLYPLTAFAKRDKVLSALLPPAVEFGTWDGELLLLPQTVQPFVTYYNVDLFNNAGLQNPNMLGNGNWNWDAVTTTARRITADKNHDGTAEIWGLVTDFLYSHRTAMWVFQAGGSYFDKWVNPTKATYLSSPGVATGLTFVHNLVYENQAIPLAAVQTTGVTQFTKGTVGMLFEGLWQIGNNKSGKFWDWDVAPLPQGPVHNGTLVQFDGMQMVKGTKHPEEAWEWMRFLVTDERAYNLLMQATGRPSSAIRALPYYLKIVQENGVPAHLNVLADAVMNPNVAPCIPAVANVTEVHSVWAAESKKYINNQQSLQVTLEVLNESVNRIIQAAKGTTK